MVIRYVPELCPVAHDTVPAEVVRSIETLAARFQGEVERNACATLVRELCALHPLVLKQIIDTLDPKYRPMVLLHRGEVERRIPTLWLLGWSTTQGTDIHDHGTSEVGIHVLRGQIRERVYACPSHCDFASRRECGYVVYEHERELHSGSTVGLRTPYIHEVYGYGTDAERDISVHAYFPPLVHMRYFKHEAGRLFFQEEWEGKCPG